MGQTLVKLVLPEVNVVENKSLVNGSWWGKVGIFFVFEAALKLGCNYLDLAMSITEYLNNYQQPIK